MHIQNRDRKQISGCQDVGGEGTRDDCLLDTGFLFVVKKINK